MFSTPFLYNPANGALLIDFKFTSFSATGGGEFDVIDCNSSTNCVINSLFASPAATTGTLNSGNNVVQVTYVAATPEPSSIMLAIAGLAGMGVYARCRSRKAV